ncbi:zinc-ribbon domain-containing protein [Streptomyces sp. NPDC060194]|uniref:zinc-ribbon domain-containing protein n=1 Tax=Streptomyces sp. NPDC060194 TaxID=3347069 RepID=UPI0036484C13
MIIFGTKAYLHTLAMLTLLCGVCGNPAAHPLTKRVTKFTLFFVPLFPVSTRYRTQCTFCGAERKLDAAEAERLLATGGIGGGGAAGSPAPAPRQSHQD